jgi:hypothetical protein
MGRRKGRGGEGAIKERVCVKSVATLLSQLCKGLIELNVRKELSLFPIPILVHFLSLFFFVILCSGSLQYVLRHGG